MRRAIPLLVIAAMVLSAAPAPAQQGGGYKVVAHPSVSADTVTAKDLARIFLKQRSSWPRGERAEPVDLKVTAPVRAAFSEAVLGKSLNQVESYWQGQVFAGRATPPPAVASDEEVLEFVRSTPGAVGYVAASTPTSGVKVLEVQ